MRRHRHVIIYFASDEGSSSKPFELFQGHTPGYRTLQSVNKVGNEAYELVFYSKNDEHQVAYDFEELGMVILRQTINERIVSENESLEKFIWPPEPEEVAAE